VSFTPATADHDNIHGEHVPIGTGPQGVMEFGFHTEVGRRFSITCSGNVSLARPEYNYLSPQVLQNL
jgi:hypothetical protein